MKRYVLSVLVATVFVLNAYRVEAKLITEHDEVVVTATRIAQSNYKIASNVTVLTAEQIQASPAQNLADILEEAVGVFVTDNSTLRSKVIDIRGFGDTATRNVLVLIDGRRVNAIDISAPDLTQIPLEAIERIEIIRGAGSVLYGDNAVGGVVNIITKQGEGEFSGYVGGTHGNYDARSTDMEVSGEKNNVSYYFFSKYNDQRGYRKNSDLLAKDFSSRLGYDFTDTIKTDLSVGYHKDVQELPGGLSGPNLTTLGRRGSASNNDTSSSTDRYVKLTLDVEPWPEDETLGEIVVDFYYRNRDVYTEFNSFSSFHTKRSLDTKGLSAKYIFDRTIFEKEVNFVTGIDYYEHENDILGSGTNPDDLTISKDEYGIYGFLQYELMDDVFINGGTRYHKADYTFNQRNLMTESDRDPDDWVSMVGAKWEYAKGSSIHMNAQQTFRFPTTDEWYSSFSGTLNTALDPQSGIQYEAGIKHNFDDIAIVSVTPYYILMDDEIFFDPVTFANGNLDKTRRIGVEFSKKVDLLSIFELDILDKLEYFANYTFQNPEFIRGANKGKDVPLVPRQQAGTGLIVGFNDHVTVSLLGTYIGSRFAINDTANATTPAKPYFIFDGKVSYKLKHLEVFGSVNNITNVLYSPFVVKSAFSSTKNFFPAPERNFTAGVKFRF